jgi:2-oxoacid:acceptor oxidoreductase delta subunit (pyruvate/2-ketoisovalerate family)
MVDLANTEIFTKTESSWSDASGDLLCLHTGDWRTVRPVFNYEKCNACGFCYIYCPPQCITDAPDGIHYQADLDYCKGCGVCAKECPTGAITMEPEADFAEECHVG